MKIETKVLKMMLVSVGAALLAAPRLAEAGAPVCAQPPANLVSWWSGAWNAADGRGGNHGIPRNGACFGPGIAGAAFSLDGIDDYVEIPSAPNLNFTGTTQSFTLEAWVYRRSTGAPHVIYDKTTPGPPFIGYRLVLVNDRVNLRTDGPDDLKFNCGADDGAVVTANAWHHVAGTFDSAARQSRVYLDGKLQAACPYPGSGRFSNDTNAWIGAFTSARGGFFDGLIDEVGLHGRALSGLEIETIFNAGSSGK